MKVLVTGASGLLGRAVLAELQQSGHDVVGTALSRAADNLIKVNMLHPDEIASCMARVRPNCVIHCAATRKPDICEHDPEQTRRLNVDAARTIAAEAARTRAWLIHISTDYVFDGTNPPYAPEDAPNPLNAYGRSKLASEEAVRDYGADFCILRVPILYGHIESLDESPVTVIAAELLAGNSTQFDNWATRYPTHTADVAFVLRQMIDHKIANSRFAGLCHWSGSEPYTKFGMAQVFCDIMGIPKETITPQDQSPKGAPRPKNSHLDCTLLQSLDIGRQTPFAKGAALAVQTFLPKQ